MCRGGCCIRRSGPWGLRIPEHTVTQALLAELGEPLLSSTLLMPGQDEPMTQG